MENFEFCVPTNVIFGKGQVERLPEAVGAFGKKVLLAYGGGSVIDCCKAIAALCAFFEGLGVPMSFGELGVGPEHFDEMAEHAVEAEGLAYARVALAPADVRAIYEMCL